MAGDRPTDPDPNDPLLAGDGAGDGAVPTPDAQPDEPPRPAERLRARAAATDRAGRFETRLVEVRRMQERRRRTRRLVRVGWVVLVAGLGALAPIVLAAVLGQPDPDGRSLLLGAVVGAILGGLGPTVRNAVARRRGASAWDAYTERYVLLGDPSATVRDADRAEPDGPPPPGDRR